MLRYEWVWYKSRATGFLNANRAPLKKSENILVFYQKSPVYHPQFTYGEPYRKTNPRSGCSTNYGKFERTGSESSDGRRYPGNVLFVPTVTGGIHPTQKPVELCEYSSALKMPPPSTPSPPSVSSRCGWPWPGAGKENSYRKIPHHLRRSPVALLCKESAGRGGKSLSHHEH